MINELIHTIRTPLLNVPVICMYNMDQKCILKHAHDVQTNVIIQFGFKGGLIIICSISCSGGTRHALVHIIYKFSMGRQQGAAAAAEERPLYDGPNHLVKKMSCRISVGHLLDLLDVQ